MRRIFSIFVLLTVAFALIFPDAAMAFGLCDCCQPSAQSKTAGVKASGHDHCAHMAAIETSSKSLSGSTSFRGVQKSHTPCECGFAAFSNSVLLAVHPQNIFATTSSPATAQEYDTRFPVHYGLINSERGPPTQH
jgi:hypothetical protein